MLFIVHQHRFIVIIYRLQATTVRKESLLLSTFLAFSFFLTIWLIAGATGTGKTVYVKSQIDALNTATYQNIQTAFSAQTSANQIQDIIDLKLDKRRKVTLATPQSCFGWSLLGGGCMHGQKLCTLAYSYNCQQHRKEPN